MKNQKRLILIEFNELCPSLLDKWMAAGFLPNFRAFYEKSDVYVTEADEAKAPNLEPWIQWYSLHTGLPYRIHGVFHLTDGPRTPYEDIWGALLRHGKTVWNCSSMNARAIGGPKGYFLPDPWCASQAANPPELDVFSKFVSGAVKEYSNSARREIMADFPKFAWFMATHGLSRDTIHQTAVQLASEIRARTAWRRVAIMDLLLFDVFRHYYKTVKPDFSTFFVNSTAHLQHSYWRQMAPQEFEVAPNPEEIERFGGAILFGYQKMDALLGRFIRLAGSDTTLMFATALSQQPFLKYESIGGQHFYRPRSIEALLQLLRITPESIEPVMTHQFMARFKGPQEALEARQRLSAICAGELPVFGFDESSEDSIYFGCKISVPMKADAPLTLKADGAPAKFFDHFYQIEAVKSGCHHPDGCFWIYGRRNQVHERKVSILDVFPTILEHFDIPADGCIGNSVFARSQEKTPELVAAC